MLDHLHPGGFVLLAKLPVTLGECAQRAASVDADLGPACPGAPLAEQPPGPDDPLASSYLAQPGFSASVAQAAGIAVARLTALPAGFKILCAAGGAVTVLVVVPRYLPSKNEGSNGECGEVVKRNAYGITRALRACGRHLSCQCRSTPVAGASNEDSSYLHIARHLPRVADQPNSLRLPATYIQLEARTKFFHHEAAVTSESTMHGLRRRAQSDGTNCALADEHFV